MFSSWLDWGHMVWRGRPQRSSAISITYHQHDLVVLTLAFLTWLTQCVPGISMQSLSIPSAPSMMFASEGSHHAQPRLQQRGITSISIPSACVGSKIRVLLPEKCVSSSLLIQSLTYQNGLRAIYLILCTKPQYCFFTFLLKLLQLSALGTLSIDSRVPLTCPHHFCVCTYLLVYLGWRRGIFPYYYFLALSDVPSSFTYFLS